MDVVDAHSLCSSFVCGRERNDKIFGESAVRRHFISGLDQDMQMGVIEKRYVNGLYVKKNVKI